MEDKFTKEYIEANKTEFSLHKEKRRRKRVVGSKIYDDNNNLLFILFMPNIRISENDILTTLENNGRKKTEYKVIKAELMPNDEQPTGLYVYIEPLNNPTE